MEKDINNYNTAVCFFIHSVQKNDSKETINAEKRRFYDLVNKNPTVWREFINVKDDEHLIYNCSNIISINPSKGTNVVDLDNFLKAIDILRNERKMKKRYYACIYKSMIEGLWGTGFEKMKPEVFCNFMQLKGINVGKKSNIYKYMPQGNYPDWDYGNIINKEENNSVIARIMEIYNELKKNHDY